MVDRPSTRCSEGSWQSDAWDAEEYRRILHEAADLVADYHQQVAQRPVLSESVPGEVSALLTEEAPELPVAWDQLREQIPELVFAHNTHWNHPGFMAYFGITGSAPGVVGELLTAALNVNAMLWRTSPVATEMELRVVDWVRSLVGLPGDFRGHINDTASTSTLVALVAARHQSDSGGRQRGASSGATVYCSAEAHSSVDKAVLVAGIGLDNLRRIDTDNRRRMRPEVLAAAIESDLEAGRVPTMVVATVGTTSTTSVDPIDQIADLCAQHGVWLHVDAAYAGPAAICPEFRFHFEGWQRSDSVVLNPHKWMFTPLDCSLLFVRQEERLLEAMSLTPEYLKTSEVGVSHLMDRGFQLGRRFRALKLWMVLQSFGASGIRAVIRQHVKLATQFAAWIEQDPRFELTVPVPFSTVCFRLRGSDQDNQELVDQINAEGRVFLSITRVGGKLVLRAAISQLRTDRARVEELQEALGRLCQANGEAE